MQKLQTSIDDNGLTYCTGALVEFLTSKARLNGLPAHYFPIKSHSWTFTTKVTTEDGKMKRVRVTWHQLPIEGGFASTGQSAQGQTLPTILCDLHLGGFYAYVSASRARTRHGLFITKPVTLANLNRQVIPLDLWFEMKQFNVIAHNTLVTWNMIQGDYMPVPEAEGEHRGVYTKTAYHIEHPEASKPKDRKRKADNQLPKLNKRWKIIPDSTTSKHSIVGGIKNVAQVFVGPSWDPTNYSCTYDSTLVVLFHVYSQLSTRNQQIWSLQFGSPNLFFLIVKLLLNSLSKSSPTFWNNIRDTWRERLYVITPVAYR